MSIFSETITKAINDYRALLRRYLTQPERMLKLSQLRLRDSETYKNDLSLYKVAHMIVTDVEHNMVAPNKGYYSYSGLQQFAQYLREYLDHYEIEENQVIHRAQKASRALLQSIQLTGLSKERLDERVVKKLFTCNEIIVSFGSDEQCDLQRQVLDRQRAINPGFHSRIIFHLESLLAKRSGKQSAA